MESKSQEEASRNRGEQEREKFHKSEDKFCKTFVTDTETNEEESIVVGRVKDGGGRTFLARQNHQADRESGSWNKDRA